jgi:predicted TIM-barrel fold metal-dependent hydrolase
MHVWDLGRHYHAWLQDEPLPPHPAGDVSPIARSYLIDDYSTDIAGCNVVGAVYVECGLPDAERLRETDWLQSLVETRGWPNAIVAGATLESPDAAASIEAQASRTAVRGIRQILNWHSDARKTYCKRNLLDDPAWQRGFALLSRFGLSFDLQIYPSQMAQAAALAAAHPDTLIILNHTGMPVDRDEAGFAVWRDGMARLAAHPNVMAKISGLGLVDPDWTIESIRPFVLETIDLFGPERSMFASNLPVDKLYGSVADVFGSFAAIVAGCSTDEREQLFQRTATRAYRLTHSRAR